MIVLTDNETCLPQNLTVHHLNLNLVPLTTCNHSGSPVKHNEYAPKQQMKHANIPYLVWSLSMLNDVIPRCRA